MILKIKHQFKFHFIMAKVLSMVSQKTYKLSVNEGFVIFWTSKLITYFIDSFTLKMKS